MHKSKGREKNTVSAFLPLDFAMQTHSKIRNVPFSRPRGATGNDAQNFMHQLLRIFVVQCSYMKFLAGRSAPQTGRSCRFCHLLSPIRHYFPDCRAVNWSAAGAAHGNLTPPRISPSCTDGLRLSLCRSTIIGR